MEHRPDVVDSLAECVGSVGSVAIASTDCGNAQPVALTEERSRPALMTLVDHDTSLRCNSLQANYLWLAHFSRAAVQSRPSNSTICPVDNKLADSSSRHTDSGCAGISTC